MTHAETIAHLSAEIALLALVTWVVIMFFMLLHKVPFRKLHLPAQPALKFQISDEPEELLPTECWGEEHPAYSTLAKFRTPALQIQKAIQQYNEDQVIYAHNLWAINQELQSVLLDRDAEGLTNFLQYQKFTLQKRTRASEGDSSLWKQVPLIESLTWAISEFILKRHGHDTKQAATGQEKPARISINTSQREPPRTPNIELGKIRSKTDTPMPVVWMSEYKKFTRNVHTFCAHVGVPTDHLLPPWDRLESLRTLAAERRPEQVALVAERDNNTRLRAELAGLRRVAAASQIRHTVEKLVFELPQIPHYGFSTKRKNVNKPGETSFSQAPGVRATGPKWAILWEDIWEVAETVPGSLFSNTRRAATGFNERRNLERKGKELFANMSSEIHDYNERHSDYEQFDPATNAIARVLFESLVKEKDGNGEQSDDIDWKGTIDKFPIKE